MNNKNSIEEALAIKALKDSDLTVTEVSKKFNIARCTVRGIWNGTAWKYLP